MINIAQAHHRVEPTVPFTDLQNRVLIFFKKYFELIPKMQIKIYFQITKRKNTRTRLKSMFTMQIYIYEYAHTRIVLMS